MAGTPWEAQTCIHGDAHACRQTAFAPVEKVEPLLATLLELNGIDTPDAGVAAVMRVEKFLHLRTGNEALPAKEATR